MSNLKTIKHGQYPFHHGTAQISSKTQNDYIFIQKTPTEKYYINPFSINIPLKSGSSGYFNVEFVCIPENVNQLDNIDRIYGYVPLEQVINTDYSFFGIFNLSLEDPHYRNTFNYDFYIFNNEDFLINNVYMEIDSIKKYYPNKIINIESVLKTNGYRNTVYIDVIKTYEKKSLFSTGLTKCRKDDIYDGSYNWHTDINEIQFPHGLTKQHNYINTPFGSVAHVELLVNEQPEVYLASEPKTIKTVFLIIHSYAFIKDEKIYIYFPTDWNSNPDMYGVRHVEVFYDEYIIPFGEFKCCLAECFGITE